MYATFNIDPLIYELLIETLEEAMKDCPPADREDFFGACHNLHTQLITA